MAGFGSVAGSGWKARASTGPAWPGTCTPRGWRWSRWTAPTARAPAQGQERHRRCHRSGPGGPGPAPAGGAQDQRRQRGSHPGTGGGQTLGPGHQDEDLEPDPSSRLHRSRGNPPVPARAFSSDDRQEGGWYAAQPRRRPRTYATKTALRASAAGSSSSTPNASSSTSSWPASWPSPPPGCSACTGWARTAPPPCWWPPVTTRAGCGRRRPGPGCAG